MAVANLLKVFRPNTASFGYASFLAVNAAGAWGGVFPFLPISIQTQSSLLWFSFAQSGIFALCFLASVIGVYWTPGPTRHLIVRFSSIPYLIGWVCLIGAMYLKDLATPFMVASGAFIGLGSAGFYMLWQRLFAAQDSDTGNRNLILGTAMASILYFALHLIPRAVTVYLIPLVIMPFFALTITLESRKVNFDQPMFTDIPKRHAAVYRNTIKTLARPALCISSLGLCAGLMRALAINDPTIGGLVNTLSMGAAFVAAVVFLVLWQFKNVRLNVTSLFRVIFPLVITGFLLLPFLNEPYAQWYAALLYAAYNIAIILMMIQSAQVSRDQGTNPVFVYGFFGGVVYLFHDAGFIGGSFVGQVSIAGLSTSAVCALGSIYILGFMYFFGQGGFQQALRSPSRTVPDVELLALHTQTPTPTKTQKSNSDTREDNPRDPIENNYARKVSNSLPNTNAKQPDSKDAILLDRISKQIIAVQAAYRLSARETEVMEHIVRGKTVVRIAEELVISENTVRMHSKRIYSKLDVHKKQDLIDLVESFRPATPEPAISKPQAKENFSHQ